MVNKEENFSLAPMMVQDLPGVRIIEKQAFTTPWSFQSFVSELTANDNAHYLVARLGEQIIGYIGMWIILDEGHITNIAVLKEYRNRGIGRLLLEAMELLALQHGVGRMTLEVRVSNSVAQGLYRKIGYRPCGLRPEYYRDNKEDALIMWKDLKNNEEAQINLRD